jgi:hypothetical protein
MATKGYAQQDDASFWPVLKVAVAAGRYIPICRPHLAASLHLSVKSF